MTKRQFERQKIQREGLREGLTEKEFMEAERKYEAESRSAATGIAVGGVISVLIWGLMWLGYKLITGV